MKRINSLNDLVQFGINPLTGEACAYGMRTLCDLSEKGCENIAAFLGMPYDPDLPRWQEFRQNWNTRVGEDVAVASIMLARGMFHDLYKFLLFRDGVAFVVEHPDGSFTGVREEEEYADMYRRMAVTEEAYANGTRLWTNYDKTGSGRNQHAFTGRTE